MKKDQIVIYKDENNSIQLDVRMEGEMLWLDRQQMATLYGRDYKTISKHINNALKEELAGSEEVVAKFATTTQHGAMKDKTQTHDKEYFNLEMVTSVGYRVKSSRGVMFRKWANKVLKQYLLKGYAINERIRKEHIGELRQMVQVIGRTLQHQELSDTIETQELLNVVVDYTYALDTLDNYDYERLTIDKITKQESFHATYENAMEAISGLREKFGSSSLLGEELYPSVEEKAAMLLYLVTKNHSFSDGNKRIAATLFLWFLNNNGILYRKDGSKRLADNTLVALTLMIAESKTEEKDVMVKVVVNLINQKN